MTNALRAALGQLSEAKRQLDNAAAFEPFSIIEWMKAAEKLSAAAHAVLWAYGGQDETEERPNG